ncbi:MAG TPA: hypothetical protein V6C97_27620 [Oculatellaceae cyanobacterium]
MWDTAAWVTLTYSEETVPQTPEGLLTLRREDVPLFIKRLRFAIYPLKIRVYIRSEYGDEPTERPHYHLVIYGYPQCLRGQSFFNPNTNSCCPHCDLIRDAWGHGNITSQPFCEENARYLAKYSTKNLRQKDNPDLYGREPEKTWGSNRPGLGTAYMHEVASTLLEYNFEEVVDVPSTLRFGGKIRPLGPTLTRKLRQYMGREPNAPIARIMEKLAELEPIRKAAFESAAPGHKHYAYKSALIELGHGKRIQLAAKARRQRKGKI